MTSKKLIVGFLLAGFSMFPFQSALAEETTTESTSQKQTDSFPSQQFQQIQQAQQMVGNMMGSMIEAMAKSMAKPEVAEYFATFTKQYYDALVTRGFSKEEALQIVTATGLPGVGKKQ